MADMPAPACCTPWPATTAIGGRKLHLALVTLVSMVAAGCGGGGSDEPPRPRAEGSIHRFTAPAGGCPANVLVEVGDRWVVASTDVAPGTDVLVEIPSGTGKTAQVFAQTPCDKEMHALSEPFPIAPSQKITTYRWDRVTDSPAFPPMDGAGAVTFGGRMWLLGGWHWDTAVMPRRTSNAVWSSTDGVHWDQVKPNTYDESYAETGLDWEGRHTAGYGVLDRQLVIAGGDGNSGKYQADVWASKDGSTWEMRAARSPLDQRLLFQTFVLGQRMCAYGGQTIPDIVASPERHYDDLWCTTDGRSWSEVATDGPRPFQRSGILGQAVLNGEVWVLGGGRYEWPVNAKTSRFNDVWRSRDLARWERVLDRAPWEGRIYHNVAAFDDRVWVLAGYGQNNLGDAWYSKDGFNWYQLEVPWAPRHAASVFVHDGSLWLAAGIVYDSNEVWRLRRADGAAHDGGATAAGRGS